MCKEHFCWTLGNISKEHTHRTLDNSRQEHPPPLISWMLDSLRQEHSNPTCWMLGSSRQEHTHLTSWILGGKGSEHTPQPPPPAWGLSFDTGYLNLHLSPLSNCYPCFSPPPSCPPPLFQSGWSGRVSGTHVHGTCIKYYIRMYQHATGACYYYL